MDEKDFEIEEMFDELLAEEMICDANDCYSNYRDMWSDNLHAELEKLFTAFVKPARHGYYAGMPEKFLEHSISMLCGITNCDVRANDGIIIALKKTVEVKHEVPNEIVERI